MANFVTIYNVTIARCGKSDGSGTSGPRIESRCFKYVFDFFFYFACDSPSETTIYFRALPNRINKFLSFYKLNKFREEIVTKPS